MQANAQSHSIFLISFRVYIKLLLDVSLRLCLKHTSIFTTKVYPSRRSGQKRSFRPLFNESYAHATVLSKIIIQTHQKGTPSNRDCRYLAPPGDYPLTAAPSCGNGRCGSCRRRGCSHVRRHARSLLRTSRTLVGFGRASSSCSCVWRRLPPSDCFGRSLCPVDEKYELSLNRRPYPV